MIGKYFLSGLALFIINCSAPIEQSQRFQGDPNEMIVTYNRDFVSEESDFNTKLEEIPRLIASSSLVSYEGLNFRNKCIGLHVVSQGIFSGAVEIENTSALIYFADTKTVEIPEEGFIKRDLLRLAKAYYENPEGSRFILSQLQGTKQNIARRRMLNVGVFLREVGKVPTEKIRIDREGVHWRK